MRVYRSSKHEVGRTAYRFRRRPAPTHPQGPTGLLCKPLRAERPGGDVDVDFELDDVTVPYSAMGWDIIFRIQHVASRTVDIDAGIVYELAAAMLIPDLRYEMSLIATPAYAITRWSPPAGGGFASVVTCETSCGISVQILFDG